MHTQRKGGPTSCTISYARLQLDTVCGVPPSADATVAEQAATITALRQQLADSRKLRAAEKQAASEERRAAAEREEQCTCGVGGAASPPASETLATARRVEIVMRNGRWFGQRSDRGAEPNSRRTGYSTDQPRRGR